jgi:hypothetical protein
MYWILSEYQLLQDRRIIGWDRKKNMEPRGRRSKNRNKEEQNDYLPLSTSQ